MLKIITDVNYDCFLIFKKVLQTKCMAIYMQFAQDELAQNEIINFPHLIPMANLSPITLTQLFLFFLTLLHSGFFFQFQACITYCFHANLFLVLVWMY